MESTVTEINHLNAQCDGPILACQFEYEPRYFPFVFFIFTVITIFISNLFTKKLYHAL